MKIRIEQSQKETKLSQSVFDRMRGKPAPIHTYYSVDLKVELTNEEKAIIRQYHLGDIVLEEYRNDYVLDPLIEQYNATPPFDEKKRASLKYRIDLASDPIRRTLSEFVHENGFSRGCDSLREATDYAQRLKTDILPKIKNAIEHYSATGGKSSDTFEL